MSDKKLAKKTEDKICALIDNIRRDLKRIKTLAESNEAGGSVMCDEARNGARKLLMARKIAK